MADSSLPPLHYNSDGEVEPLDQGVGDLLDDEEVWRNAVCLFLYFFFLSISVPQRPPTRYYWDEQKDDDPTAWVQVRDNLHYAGSAVYRGMC